MRVDTPTSLSFGCFERQLALTTAAFSRLPLDPRVMEARLSLHELGKTVAESVRQEDVTVGDLQYMHQVLVDDVLAPVCGLPDASSFRGLSVLKGSLQATRTLQQVIPDEAFAQIGMEEGVNTVFKAKSINFSRILAFLELFTGPKYSAQLAKNLSDKLDCGMASNTFSGALSNIDKDLCTREPGRVAEAGGRPTINIALTPLGKEVTKRAYLSFYRLLGLTDVHHRFDDAIVSAGCFGIPEKAHVHFFNVPFVNVAHFCVMMILLEQVGQGFGFAMIDKIRQKLSYEPTESTVYNALRNLEEAGWVTSANLKGSTTSQNIFTFTEEGLRVALKARHTWLAFLGFPIEATFPHYEVMMGRL